MAERRARNANRPDGPLVPDDCSGVATARSSAPSESVRATSCTDRPTPDPRHGRTGSTSPTHRLGLTPDELSLAAQWLLNARLIQTWWFWMAADVIYIPLYAWKRLDLTALVYALFLGLCVLGLRDWRRCYAAQLAEPSTAVPTR